MFVCYLFRAYVVVQLIVKHFLTILLSLEQLTMMMTTATMIHPFISIHCDFLYHFNNLSFRLSVRPFVCLSLSMLTPFFILFYMHINLFFSFNLHVIICFLLCCFYLLFLKNKIFEFLVNHLWWRGWCFIFIPRRSDRLDSFNLSLLVSYRTFRLFLNACLFSVIWNNCLFLFTYIYLFVHVCMYVCMFE